MFQYWTTWNFIWYSGFKLNIYNLNTPLKTSIFSTALVGGYLVYVYPRKIKIKFNDNSFYTPPYYMLVIGDLLLHQYPLLDIMTKTYKINKMCILYTYIPIFSWYALANKIVHGETKKIYGVNIKNILAYCSTVALGFGVYHHLIKK